MEHDEEEQDLRVVLSAFVLAVPAHFIFWHEGDDSSQPRSGPNVAVFEILSDWCFFKTTPTVILKKAAVAMIS